VGCWYVLRPLMRIVQRRPSQTVAVDLSHSVAHRWSTWAEARSTHCRSANGPNLWSHIRRRQRCRTRKAWHGLFSCRAHTHCCYFRRYCVRVTGCRGPRDSTWIGGCCVLECGQWREFFTYRHWWRAHVGSR
jgi:hypothetical protein